MLSARVSSIRVCPRLAFAHIPTHPCTRTVVIADLTLCASCRQHERRRLSLLLFSRGYRATNPHGPAARTPHKTHKGLRDLVGPGGGGGADSVYDKQVSPCKPTDASNYGTRLPALYLCAGP